MNGTTTGYHSHHCAIQHWIHIVQMTWVTQTPNHVIYTVDCSKTRVSLWPTWCLIMSKIIGDILQWFVLREMGATVKISVRYTALCGVLDTQSFFQLWMQFRIELRMDIKNKIKWNKKFNLRKAMGFLTIRCWGVVPLSTATAGVSGCRPWFINFWARDGRVDSPI